jgi:hypothetical protein
VSAASANAAWLIWRRLIASARPFGNFPFITGVIAPFWCEKLTPRRCFASCESTPNWCCCVVMRFSDWMTMTNSSNAAFGERLGKSGETVRRYRAGEREPDFETISRIFDLTGGKVTPNDWVGVAVRAADASQVNP